MLLKGCVLVASLFGAAYGDPSPQNAGVGASSVASVAASQASGVISSARSQATSAAVGASSSVATAQTSSTSQAQNVHGTASTPVTTYSDSLVPTGTPIPGNYTGKLRPQIHYSPPEGFMNDPNGMFVDAQGIWHLYYQYNPTATVAGNQHWGHATSRDLYHWENQPIALFPPNDYTYVYSGSAVVDVNNTSGFFPNSTTGVVAIYTLAEYPNGQAGPQQQAIAYSTDGGYSFTPYANNPVIASESSQFRDPKVVWYGNHWVAVIAYSQEFAIGIFTSPNLKDWTATSNFSYHGILGLQYECPNLVEMPVEGTNDTMWVMQISINPGAPLGGSVEQYFPGSFNGTHFTAVDAVTRFTDFSKDRYAGQFFYGTPHGSDAVSIGWASNWQYTQLTPTGPSEGWRSTMSLPRRNFITNATRIGYVMASAPYDLEPVLGQTLAQNSSLGNGTILVDFADISSNAIYFEVNVTGINTTTVNAAATFNFTFSSPVSNEYLRGGFYFAGDPHFFIDRGGIRGFDNVFFTDKFSTTTPINAQGTWSMSAVIDRSIFEVFLEGGEYSGTSTFYPEERLTQLVLGGTAINQGIAISVRVRAIQSAWAQYENSMGTVYGDTTMVSNLTMATMANGQL